MERITPRGLTTMNTSVFSTQQVLPALGAIFLSIVTAAAANLEVGPGKPLARIEDAAAKAAPGDTILIHPREGGQPYEKTAIFVRQKGLTFRGVPAKGERYVKISGKGFDYSGSGSTPRAIFQFNKGTDNCTLEGLELFAAHNSSHNGAGVRINQANNVTVRNCSIHNNDMGIMSNGDGSLTAAVNQRIEHCEIHHNGDPADPGYNHNLYLGGTSVTLRFCEVHHSLTGHNVKSRAHNTRVEYCYIHDSANREFDLVDAAETAKPDSHAVLMGNVIVKDPKCPGNRATIHFGRDGKQGHDGTIHLVFNTIVTPFLAPVVELSTPQAKASLIGNIVCDGGAKQAKQTIVSVRNGARLSDVTGTYNWFSGDFGGVGGTGLDAKTNLFRRADGPIFVNPSAHDFRLRPDVAKTAVSPLAAAKLVVPAVAGATRADSDAPLAWQYGHPLRAEKRADKAGLTLGAHGR
jgi:hypothetical protein